VKRSKPSERIKVRWLTREGVMRTLFIYPSNLESFYREVQAQGGQIPEEWGRCSACGEEMPTGERCCPRSAVIAPGEVEYV
jgi:hypothetical protein